jgi:hypothetical protein
MFLKMKMDFSVDIRGGPLFCKAKSCTMLYAGTLCWGTHSLALLFTILLVYSVSPDDETGFL